MTSVPPIPPLLCSTPPPMDFGDEEEEDDDIELPPTLTQVYDGCDEFGDFALTTETTESVSAYNDIAPANVFTDVPPELHEHSTVLDINSDDLLRPASKQIQEAKEQQINTKRNQKLIETFNLNVSRVLNKNGDVDSDSDVSINCDEKVTKITNSTMQSMESPIINSLGNQGTSAVNGTQDETVTKNCAVEKNESDAMANNVVTANVDIKESTVVKTNTEHNHYVGVVSIEDVEDDSSDDEYLTRKKVLFLPDENSADYFAIHNVNAEDEAPVNSNEIVDPNLPPVPKEITSQLANVDIDDSSDFEFSDFSSAPMSCEQQSTNSNVENEFKADFSAFNEEPTTSDSQNVENIVKNEAVQIMTATTETGDDTHDDFDDFQDFSTAPIEANEPITSLTKELPVTKNVLIETLANKVDETNNDNVDNNGDDDDDDFGDFSEATFTPATTNNAKHETIIKTHSVVETAAISNIMPVTSSNLNERLKGILEVMFPSISPKDSENNCRVEKVNINSVAVPLQSIDTAKALEYQWTNSEVRHALIRSLGIDSRNILFGEKWNPSMPRFAANLSFNPLKPQPAASNSATDFATPTAASGSASGNDNVPSQSTANEVPAVEFDWNSAGLVNPLDASHVHTTLLLDLDQLVMVANVDNINLDSSSSSSFGSQQNCHYINGNSTNVNCNLNVTATSLDNLMSTTLTTVTTTTTTPTTTIITPTTATTWSLFDLLTDCSTTTTTTTIIPTTTSLTNCIENDNNVVYPVTQPSSNDILHGNNMTTTITTATVTVTATNTNTTAINFTNANNVGNCLSFTATNVTGSAYAMLPNNCTNNTINTFIANNHHHNLQNFSLLTRTCKLNEHLPLLVSLPQTITTTTTTSSTITVTNHFSMENPISQSLISSPLQPLQPPILPRQYNSNVMLMPTIATSSITTTTTTTTPPPPPPLPITTTMPNSIDGDQMYYANDETILDCRHKDDVHTRETEAIDASQLGSTDRSSDLDQSRTAAAIEIDATDEYKNNNSSSKNNNNGPNTNNDDSNEISDDDANAVINTATTTPTVLSATTTTTLPSDVLSDRHGGNIDQTGEHIDLESVQQMRIGENASIETVATLTSEQKGIFELGLDELGENTVRLSNNKTNDSDVDEVHSKTTYAGPLKETHIYTPPRSSDSSTSLPKPKPSGGEPTVIDFDYEIAAAGIIINEAVVSKEYRDVEYNPPDFKLEYGRTPPSKSDTLFQPTSTVESNQQQAVLSVSTTDFDDEFTDFQSVPVQPATTTAVSHPVAATIRSPLGVSRTSTPTASDEMILSPAILLPQAIDLASSGGAQPKVEWGSSATNINPDELARIEELFPQPKALKVNGGGLMSGSSNGSSNSNSPKTTPTHGRGTATLSISASIAHKEQQHQPGAADDDDWSDFVSVSVPAATTASKQQQKHQLHTNTNNNPLQDIYKRSPVLSPQRQSTTSPVSPRRINHVHSPAAGVVKNHQNIDNNTNSNDDEWSDFVCNAAPAMTTKSPMHNTPQFNSGAWQSTSFYHNPLSFYHQQQQQHQHQQQQQHRPAANSIVPNSTSPAKFQRNGNIVHNNNINKINNNNNNNNNYVNNNNNNMPITYPSQRVISQQQTQHHRQHQHQNHSNHSHHHHQQQQQQIHVMQDFSTAPPYQHQHQRAHMAAMAAAAAAAAATTASSATVNALPFQVGSAKVAPSVSLIPDLGFVAPAMPTHTAFINALPGFGGSNSNNHSGRATFAKK